MNTNNGWLGIDQQRLALWQAIKEIKIGNLHDDKVIIANLHRAGYVIAAAPGSPAETPAYTVTVDPDPRGVSVGVYQGSSCVYHGAHPIPAGSVADEGAEDERSDTYGMNLGERIAHVGGRTNAQGYTEFGSPMAVNALIQHVLRDIDWTRQADDGAYQARYRLPSGQWSSWGHVVCGVKGHEQELRYLPGARRPAPAAGDALDAITLPIAAARMIRREYLPSNPRRMSHVAVRDAVEKFLGALEAAEAAIAQQKGEA